MKLCPTHRQPYVEGVCQQCEQGPQRRVKREGQPKMEWVYRPEYGFKVLRVTWPEEAR